MFTYTCPRTGHTRVFSNGRACKRWLKEQAQKYVPTLAEDCAAFATPVLGIGKTHEVSAGLTRSRKGGKKLAGPKGRKSIWDEPARLKPSDLETFHSREVGVQNSPNAKRVAHNRQRYENRMSEKYNMKWE